MPDSPPNSDPSGPNTAPARDRRPHFALAAFAVYTGLAFLLFRSAWAHPASSLIGGCCDSTPTVDFLEWPGYALLHGHDPLVSYWINGYQGIDLMWQVAALPVIGLLATPFELLLGPLVTYNLLATLALPLSGLACYVALRRWVGGVPGPFVGGLLYAFCPFMLGHSLGHLNLTMAFVPPLALLVLFDLLAEHRWSWRRSGAALGVLFVLQLLMGEEFVVTTAITGFVALVALLATSPTALHAAWLRSKARLSHSAKGLGRLLSQAEGPLKGCASAAAVAIVLGAVPVAVQLLGPGSLHGLLRPLDIFVVDLANPFLPTTAVSQFVPDAGAYSAQWSWLVSDMTGYLGVPLMALLAVVVINRWRARPVVRISAVTGAVMAVCSLGPSLHVAGVDVHVLLPWRLVEHLPVLENILPDRLTIFEYLAVAVLVAEGTRAVIAWSRTSKKIVGTVLVLAALVPLMPSIHYPTWTGPLPVFFRTPADVSLLPEGGMVFVAPFPRDSPANVSPMLWQAEAGMRFRMEGGYVLLPGHGPRGTDLADPTGAPIDELNSRLDALAAGTAVPALDPAGLLQLRRLLFDRYAPQTVLVGPMPQRQQAVALFTALLGRSPRVIGGVDLWLHVGPSARPGT